MSAPNQGIWPPALLVFVFVGIATVLPTNAQTNGGWTPVRSAESANEQVALDSTTSNAALSSVARTGKLPNDEGQVWREYDIRTYTRRMEDGPKPEQAVVDWILRETGTDAWFGPTVSLLSASRNAVRVYHTPRIQEIVSDVVSRFVNTRSEAHSVVVRLITIDSPNWRLKALPMLKPLQVQSPGVEAWLLSREDAALLIAELSKRTDYREHNSPQLAIYSGQTHLISSTRPRTFTKRLQRTAQGFSGLGEIGQIDEGFSLQISPLVTRDRQTMDVVIKCNVDQIERFTPLWVDTPDQFGTRQRVQIQIPQLSSWQLHERFRWPINEVLMISRGVVATPGPTGKWNSSLTRLFDGSAPRANALLFLESRSEIRSATRPRRLASGTPSVNYRGRY